MCRDTWWDGSGSRIRFHNDVQDRGRLQTLHHKTGFGIGVTPTVNWLKVRSALQTLRLSNRLIIHSDRGADRSALASADVHPTSRSQVCFLDGMPLLCPLTSCVGFNSPLCQPVVRNRSVAMNRTIGTRSRTFSRRGT